MEDYFSQLVSRNAPAGSDLLQPDPMLIPQTSEQTELSVFEAPADQIASSETYSQPQQQIQPGEDVEHQPAITQKNIQYHYLQQYFTRVDSVEEEKSLFDPATVDKKDKTTAGENQKLPKLYSKDSSDFSPSESIQTISVNEVDREKLLIPLLPNLRPSPEQERKPTPVIWLSPPAPAMMPMSALSPLSKKPTPSLIIGKILVELLPAKPVPSKIINRSSPFQATISKNGSGTVAFGLGQL